MTDVDSTAKGVVETSTAVEEVAKVDDSETVAAGRDEVSTGVASAEDVLGGAGVDDGGTAVDLLRAMVEESAGELVNGEAAIEIKVHYEFNYYCLGGLTELYCNKRY